MATTRDLTRFSYQKRKGFEMMVWMAEQLSRLTLPSGKAHCFQVVPLPRVKWPWLTAIQFGIMETFRLCWISNSYGLPVSVHILLDADTIRLQNNCFTHRLYVSLDSVVCIAASYGLDDRGARVRVPIGSRIFSTSSRPVLGPIQPPIQWVPGSLYSGVKRPRREADHSPPVSAEVKKMWIHSPHTPSWRSAWLVKHRDNFTFFTFIHRLYNDATPNILSR
jgi:hypothetical protein